MTSAEVEGQQSAPTISKIPRFLVPWPNPEASTGRLLEKHIFYTYWDVEGPALERYYTLAEEIRKHVRRFGDSPVEVSWVVRMRGIKKETARPTVIFVSEHCESRRKMAELIRSSGLLENYPGFKVIDRRLPPGFRSVRQIGGNASDKQDFLPPNSGRRITLHLQPEGLIGAKLLVCEAGADTKIATVGGILEWQGRYFITTAAHVFGEHEWNPFPHTATPTESDSDLDRSNDSDEDYRYLPDITSRGSMTTDEFVSGTSTSSPTDGPSSSPQLRWSEDAASFTLSATSHSEGTNYLPRPPSLDSTGVGLTAETRAAKARRLEHVSSRGIMPHRSSDEQICLDGPFTISKAVPNRALDYALVEITGLNVITSDMLMVQDQSQAYGTTANDTRNRRLVSTEIIAVTGSGGTIRGWMSAAPTFMSMRNAATPQELWTIHCDGIFQDGDCGSWVFDAVSGEPYGHIIAGSPGFGSAYIVPLKQIMNDLRRQFEGDWRVFVQGDQIRPKDQNAVKITLEDSTNGQTSLVRTSAPTEGESSGPKRNSFIEDFKDFVKKSEVVCISEGDDEVMNDHPFVPYTALEAYFERPKQMQSLLATLFPGKMAEDLPSTNTIRRKYLRVFSILVSINKGYLITAFMEKRLLDGLLPFSNSSSSVMSSIEGSDNISMDVISSFTRVQWKFCTPILKGGMNENFNQDSVLPILRREKLNQVDLACTYKIVLHEGYNQLYTASTRSDKRSAASNTFVLKRYSSPVAKEYYKDEIAAYRKIRSSKLRKKVIGFLGSFTQGDTYNIILEHADKGSLETFMKSTPPPLNAGDILTFWNKLFSIIPALETLHDTPVQANEITGWHHDIKPTNILIMSRKGGSTYDGRFLIADFGLSHFRPRELLDQDKDNTSRHTSAYGALELYKRYTGNEKHQHGRRDSIDIFSLACVFSEVAIWAAGGWNKLQDCRQRFHTDLNIIGKYFRKDSDIPRYIQGLHKSLLGGPEPYNMVSAEVLKMVKEDMLVSLESGHRQNAKHISRKATNIIAEAKDKIPSTPKMDLKSTVIVPCFCADLVKETRNGSKETFRIRPSSKAHNPSPPRAPLPKRFDTNLVDFRKENTKA